MLRTEWEVKPLRQQPDKEPLLPEWVSKWAKILLPLGILIGIWWLNDRFIHLKGIYWIPTLIGLILGLLIFFVGRYYKHWYVNREGRCVAGKPEIRLRCRHHYPGPRLGMGCGRHREDGLCAHKVGWKQHVRRPVSRVTVTRTEEKRKRPERGEKR